MDGYRIFGSELSPYSVKVRSYFRYKGLAHEWIPRSPAVQAEFQKYAKLPLVPLVVTPEGEGLRVLGRQPVDLNRPHPFTAAGNTEFNALLWMPPTGERAGDIVLIDSTHFTTLFGGTDSLRNLWHNLATMR